jgi:regulatory protein
MVISRLVKQKRHPDRVNLYVDGVFTAGLHRDVVVRFGLRKGDEISPEVLDKLRASEEFSHARLKALRLLKSRLRSAKELRSKLREKEFSPSVIEEVIENLNTLGLINDDKFARAYVHDALLKKASGRRLLQQQLTARGISRDLINTVLSDLLPENEEESLLLSAAKSYINRLRKSRKKNDEEKIRNRTVQHLIRRGFSFNQIIKTVKPLIHYEESWEDD